MMSIAGVSGEFPGSRPSVPDITWTEQSCSRRTSTYIRAAIDSEIATLRSSSSGRRCAAFRASAAIGGFVGCGAMDRSAAEGLLLAAALDTGLTEREAISHIQRGIDRGEMTPRSLPDGRAADRPRFSPSHRTTETAVDPAVTARSLRRPPKAEVDALWNASLPISSDAEVEDWFHCRYHSSWIIEHIELWDLARAIPDNLKLPRWAWSRGGAWNKTRHRILFRLWDCTGQAASVRARCIDPTVIPKSIAPIGFSIRGLVLADPLAVQLLRSQVPDWWEPREVVVAEGEPDWLLWAARQPDAKAQGPACLGIEAGSWSRLIADRIPDGARVALRTHIDAPGEKYAQQIVMTLSGRCQIFRSRGEAEATR